MSEPIDILDIAQRRMFKAYQQERKCSLNSWDWPNDEEAYCAYRRAQLELEMARDDLCDANRLVNELSFSTE